MIPRMDDVVSFDGNNVSVLKEALDRLHRLALQRCDIQQLINDAVGGGSVACPKVVNVEYSQQMTYDADTGNHFIVTLTKEFTGIIDIIGGCNRQKVTLEFVQDKHGSRKILFSPAFGFGIDIPANFFSSTGNNIDGTPFFHDYVGFINNQDTGLWHAVAFVGGYS